MADKRDRTKTATVGTDVTSLPTSDRAGIAGRACELYLVRGREEGHDVEDWLQAERELVNTPTPTPAQPE